MGRPKVEALRALASSEGWLSADTPLPEDAGPAVAHSQPPRCGRGGAMATPFGCPAVRQRSANRPAVAHSGQPWGSRGAAMADPFRVPGGAAVTANCPAGAHSGPPWGTRGVAMATPFGGPAGCPARNHRASE